MTETVFVANPEPRAALGTSAHFQRADWVPTGTAWEGDLYLVRLTRDGARVLAPVEVRPVAEQAAALHLTKREGKPGDDAIWSGSSGVVE